MVVVLVELAAPDLAVRVVEKNLFGGFVVP
jgi:hypothetical protein